MRSKLNRCDVEWIRRSAADLGISLEPEFVVKLCDIILGNETLGEERTEIGAAKSAANRALIWAGGGPLLPKDTTAGIIAKYETGREREQLQELIAKLNAPPPVEPDDTHGEWRRLNDGLE